VITSRTNVAHSLRECKNDSRSESTTMVDDDRWLYSAAGTNTLNSGGPAVRSCNSTSSA
jgi:hypothetical protein